MKITGEDHIEKANIYASNKKEEIWKTMEWEIASAYAVGYLDGEKSLIDYCKKIADSVNLKEPGTVFLEDGTKITIDKSALERGK